VLEATHPKLVRKTKPLYRLAERDTAAYAIVERIDYILEECPMAKGAKSLVYKDLLNTLEEQQPGAKQHFLTGFLKEGRRAITAGDGLGDGVVLRECSSCGQPTTAEVCAYCRMAARGQRKASEKAAKYSGS
jgi:uncharacterized protein (TIGR00269 family)